MKNSTMKLFWMLGVVTSFTFLPSVTMNQEGAYAQDSPSTTNATVLSGNDASSQSPLQKSIY